MACHQDNTPLPTSKRPLRILQLSDLHLFSSAWKTLEWGNHTPVNPRNNLKHLLLSVKRAHEFDAIFVTGDLAQEPDSLVYQQLSVIFRDMPPVFFLPGNHDNRSLFNQAVLDNHIKSLTRVRLGNWLLLGVDSCVEGEDWGYITRSTMLGLERQLASAGSLNVLVALHHLPVPCGSEWLDRIGLRNNEEFLKVIRAWKQVKIIAAGHVHQALTTSLDGLTVLSCPSTAVQFQSQSDSAHFHTDQAGANLITLHYEGALEHEAFYVDIPKAEPLEETG